MNDAFASFILFNPESRIQNERLSVLFLIRRSSPIPADSYLTQSRQDAEKTSRRFSSSAALRLRVRLHWEWYSLRILSSFPLSAFRSSP